ncbi:MULTISPECIES: VirB8 family type IV secretion system protein [Xanthomonas]|uniref:virB8 family protein n=1 Tax=Xanthomonas TaxID=338 RepID=UPI001C4864F3|nr:MULTISPECIES: VirB8/TrbF family protein [Xanthomonas]MBV6855863.1 hypothetical protein [Xanthomonas campestris pv. mirabilis]MBV6867915.1 hypothetical protein [Xanthomonas campestris pv. coriandri]MCE4330835.1 hypothetical protein [Xanthomonas campestris pv. coriandri]MEA9776966.1 VirB8/TrbF family protein [Xanthomonas campestris pv. raphani]
MIDATNKEYLEATMHFEADREASNARSVKVAWTVAVAASVLAAFAITAVVLLTPLKTVEAVVLRVNDATGYTEILSNPQSLAAMPTENEHKYWLGRYVNAREEYSNAQGFANYKTVGIMSSPEESTRYFPTMDPKNPRSMTKVYGRDGKVEVKISSITLPDDGVATVRFHRMETVKGLSKSSSWIATISYEYVGLPASPDDRMLNPRGFMVTEYRIDADTSAPAIAGAQ